MKQLICKVVGHDWAGAGWTSSTFDKESPEGVIVHLWKCTRCGAEKKTFEHSNRTQARFDHYREKYGNEAVETDEFSPPKPKP